MARDVIDLRIRTKKFALRIIKLYQNLPHTGEACRAKSPADFVNMMTGALKELDETAYWLELLMEGGIISTAKLTDLQKETDELLAIFVSSINTSKRNNSK
jgi:hypothetical protein